MMDRGEGGRQPVVLGVDLGTSGVKVIATDETGTVVASAERSYPLITPHPGWAEQNPHTWIERAIEAIRELNDSLTHHHVIALGLTGQMHGLVPLDTHGSVIRNAILWNDQRTENAVQEMLERVTWESFVTRTGNPPITGFQASKVLWLRQAEPESFSRLRHALLPKDYLGFVLTGEQLSEPSDNSGTNVFNVATLNWDASILEALELPRSIFPEVAPSHAVRGHLLPRMATATGLSLDTKIVLGAADNAASGLAMGLSSQAPTVGGLSIGTSGAIFAPITTPTPDPRGRVHLFCHADSGYYLLGVTLSAAGSLQWLRNTLFSGTSFKDLDRLAAESNPGANGVTFTPFLAGERSPYLNPALKAGLTGMSLATTKSDIVRAVLEGVAFSLREVLDVIQATAPLEQLLATGGGTKSNLWLNIIADVLAKPLSVPPDAPDAAYGASTLAWKTMGVKHTKREEGASTFAPKHTAAYAAAREAYQRETDSLQFDPSRTDPREAT